MVVIGALSSLSYLEMSRGGLSSTWTPRQVAKWVELKMSDTQSESLTNNLVLNLLYFL